MKTPDEIIIPLEQIKQEIIKSIKWETVRSNVTGGQSCGMMDTGITLISEETGVNISISCYRSSLKNKELALILFQLAIDEILK